MTKLEELKKAWHEAHGVWSDAYNTRRESCEAYNEACVKADKVYKAYEAYEEELEKQGD